MNCMGIVEKTLVGTEARTFRDNGWGRRHCLEWKRAHLFTHAASMRRFIEGLATYADAHQKEFDSTISEDGVLGDYWLDIFKGVRGMLNGELGALDGGTLDTTLLGILEKAGFTEEDL